MNRSRELATVVGVGLVGAVFVVPFLLMLSVSFRHSAAAIADPLNPFGGGLTLDNYRRVWRETPVLRYYANSTITTVLIVVSQTVIAVAASYSIGHLRPLLARPARALVVAVLTVPLPLIAITNYVNLARFDLVNTRVALVLPFVASAFGVFLLTQYVEAVSATQLDAARVFGLGPIERFRTVVAPSIRPGITAFAAFSFVGWWNEFFWPLIALSDDGLATVPFLVRRYEISPTGLPDWGPVMAAATVALLPVALLLALLQRSFARTLRLT